MIKIGIVGGTGYTGVELLRMLAQHPQAELRAITSRKEAGMAVARCFPACAVMSTSLSPTLRRRRWTSATWCSSPRPTASP